MLECLLPEDQILISFCETQLLGPGCRQHLLAHQRARAAAERW